MHVNRGHSSLLIFSGIYFEMAAWRPYWIVWFLDSKFSLVVNLNSKLQWPYICVYGYEPIDFSDIILKKGPWVVILINRFQGFVRHIGFFCFRT